MMVTTGFQRYTLRRAYFPRITICSVCTIFILAILVSNTSIPFTILSCNLWGTVKVNSTITAPIGKNRRFTSFICDKTEIDRFQISSTTPQDHAFDVYRKKTLQQYCNIVPIPRNNWTSARRYTEHDIAFVIFTASKFFHNRATAVRDTWLSRITNYYFLSATPYPYLPVTVVPGAGEDKLSNMKKIFYGLQMIYKQQTNFSVEKRQKWFYIIGCDTFILPHHLLKRIEYLDYNKPYLVGGYWGVHECLGKNRPVKRVEFPSGGAGFFFSFKLLEILQPHLTDYVENVWPKTSEMSDVALACLAKELNISLTRLDGFGTHPPAFSLTQFGRERFHRQPERNNYHYVNPDEMYALDEFYVNQHFDRLVNDHNWDEVVKYSRRFMASHYLLLRKKRQECTLPIVGEEVRSQ